MTPNTLSVFIHLLIFHCCLSLILLAKHGGAQQNFNVGDPCKTDGLVPLTGFCKVIKDCPSAISNLRVGIQPTLCSALFKGSSVVCCPAQERVSEKKCREYQQIRQHKIRLNPLLPLEFVNSEVGEDGPGRTPGQGQGGCEVRANSLISGGRNAKENEFPFIGFRNYSNRVHFQKLKIANGRPHMGKLRHTVAIGYGELKEKKWGCGGSLISEEYVITAAHCIDTVYGRPRRVLVGELYLQHPSNKSRKALVAIENIIVHPDYKPPLKYNDVALIKLTKKIPLTKSVLPICLPQPKNRLDLLKDYAISGWGTIGAAGGQSNILLTANIQRYDQKRCNDYYSNAQNHEQFFPQGIIRNQLCGADSKNDAAEKQDTCRGDSGGPLSLIDKQCTTYLVGITSFGARLCGFGSPSVYTTVQAYLDWIEKTVWPNEM